MTIHRQFKKIKFMRKHRAKNQKVNVYAHDTWVENNVRSVIYIIKHGSFFSSPGLETKHRRPIVKPSAVKCVYPQCIQQLYYTRASLNGVMIKRQNCEYCSFTSVIRRPTLHVVPIYMYIRRKFVYSRFVCSEKQKSYTEPRIIKRLFFMP